MNRRLAKQKAPEIVYIREASPHPGSPDERERILLRLDLALARRTRALLESEQQANHR